MERTTKAIFEMNSDEIYAYALGAGTARMAVHRSEESAQPFTYYPGLVRINMPEDILPQHAHLYMSGFREVAAEAITKTVHMETA